MALAHVGSEQQDITSTDPKTVTSASTTLTDVLYAVQFAATVPSLTSGWTQILANIAGVGGNHISASCRVSDGSANYSFTQGTVANSAAMDAFSGADVGTLFEQANSAVNTNTVPSVTPTLDNSVQIFTYSCDNGDGTILTPPSGGGTITLLGLLDRHLVFGTVAIYMRAFGAGTGGNAQATPATGFVWGGGGTVREIMTWVIKPLGATLPGRVYGGPLGGLTPLIAPTIKVYTE